jgi:hypothetical protein
VVTETGLSKRGIPLPDPDLRAPPFVKRQILQQSHSELCGKIMHIYMLPTLQLMHFQCQKECRMLLISYKLLDVERKIPKIRPMFEYYLKRTGIYGTGTIKKIL